MLIDATHPEETRVVVVRGNRVEEFDFESAHRKQLRGNIYLAKVTRVEPSLQAAFVDYGGNRHGFLAFSEIHPDYYQIPVADRQALIEEEERAQRAADAEADSRAVRRPQRHRRGGRTEPAARGDDVVRSEPVEGDEPAPEEAGADDTAEVFAGGEAATFGGETAPGEARSEDLGPEPAPFSTSPAPAVEQGHDEPAADAVAAPGDGGAVEALASPADEDHASVAEQSEPRADMHTGREYGEDEHAESDQDEGDGGENGDNGEEEEIVESVGGSDALEEAQERTPRVRRQYKIQEVIKRRQVMLVQVVKEERGSKGAALTTYLSLAGRYSVLMPNTARGGGISRKITNAQDRKRLKEIAQELDVPEGMGVILRTAGANRTKSEIKRDFEYLLRMWENVRDLTLKSTAPKLVYEEGSLIKRAIRDLYSKDIDEIIVAGEEGYQEAKEFMRMLMPSHAKHVKLYKDSQPIFSRMGIESQLDAMFSPTVQLRSGGYIVINQAEALVAIDVNSGRATREHHIEDTALKTNLEAAEEIARQLRLRDLAGLIVIDFIDMDEKRNNRAVERRLKECLKNDRARIQVGRISHFGLLEMSRQRIRSSVLESSTERCPYCGGTGHQRSVSSLALQVLRSLEEAMMKGATHNLIVRTRPEVAIYVLNQKRAHLYSLEQRFRVSISVLADETVGAQQAFVLEKGEQVHTPEVARALAASQPAPLPAVSEAEPESEADEEEFEQEAAESGTQPADRTEGGEESRRRRRRRRRRRGGAEPREPADFTHETVAEHKVEHLEDYEPEPHREGDVVEAGAPEDEGPAQPREGRRRRRGRRGGRRNRHEREGGMMSDAGETLPAEEHAAPRLEQPQPEFASRDFEPQPMQPLYGPSEPQPAPTAFGRGPAPQGADREPAPTPSGYEPAQEAPAAPPPQPAEATAPERPRRSTVREPAPIISEDGAVISSPAPIPVPTPVPVPEPVVESTSDDADRPRRTGWWRRRA